MVAGPISLISAATPLVFIGGGNMATAIVGGLRRSGLSGDAILIVDPGKAQRSALETSYAVRTTEMADGRLLQAAMWVWAVKPQTFAPAAAACRAFSADVLQLSVMAGVRTDAIAHSTGSERVVRAMPNTPALIGQGIAGLFARDAVGSQERQTVESVLASTGQLMWVAAETDLDAVTAISGSGPAYVYYLIESMIDAAEAMGLSAEQGRQLALLTLAGSTALAQRSTESPSGLRAQVTSAGGTTQAAIESLNQNHVKAALINAMEVARQRATELGDQFSGQATRL